MDSKERLQRLEPIQSTASWYSSCSGALGIGLESAIPLVPLARGHARVLTLQMHCACAKGTWTKTTFTQRDFYIHVVPVLLHNTSIIKVLQLAQARNCNALHSLLYIIVLCVLGSGFQADWVHAAAGLLCPLVHICDDGSECLKWILLRCCQWQLILFSSESAVMDWFSSE